VETGCKRCVRAGSEVGGGGRGATSEIILLRGERGQHERQGKGAVVSFMRMGTGVAISTVAEKAVSACCSYKNFHEQYLLLDNGSDFVKNTTSSKM
jgi:hypothetical protein